MNRTVILQSNEEGNLARWGGSYIPRMQALAQLVSFGTFVLGLVYILIVADLDLTQTWVLLLSGFILIVLLDIFMLIFAVLASTRSRRQLNAIFKDRPPLNENNELQTQVWNEISKLPRNYALADMITTYLLVVLSLGLIMSRIANVSTSQMSHVVIGSAVSGTIAVLISTWVFDQKLAPVRRVLIPSDPKQQLIVSGGIWTSPRLMAAMVILSLATIVLIGMLGYQRLLNSAQSGANIIQQTSLFRNDAILIGILILICGLILSYLLSRTISRPLNELIQTVDAFQKGNFSQRAKIITSDETANLTIRVNQMLDQLQLVQTGMERQQEQQTKELLRRTLQLRVSAQVAREATAAQDVKTLLSRTADLIAAQFEYYHTGIFLLDDNRDYAVLQAASSEGGKIMLGNGHKLPVGQQGIVGAVAFENHPHVARDVTADPSFLPNPALPLTRAEAAFPLTIRNEVIGVLDIQTTSSEVFSPSDIEMLQILADQIALAIHTARLIDETRQALNQIKTTGIEDVRSAWDEEELQKKRAFRYTPMGVSPIDHPVQSMPGDENSKVEIPITLRGQKIGNINIRRKETESWDEADRALAIEVATQIGLALENARLLDDAQRRTKQEQTISKLAASFSRSLDPDALMQTAIKELHQLPNVEEVSVYLGTSESTPFVDSK